MKKDEDVLVTIDNTGGEELFIPLVLREEYIPSKEEVPDHVEPPIEKYSIGIDSFHLTLHKSKRDIWWVQVYESGNNELVSKEEFNGEERWRVDPWFAVKGRTRSDVLEKARDKLGFDLAVEDEVEDV